jgi:hypothetical protein
MNENRNLISTSVGILRTHKRYVVWFYLLNLLFAWWGAGAFSASAHEMMDHSLYADKLLHGMDVFVLGELLSQPEFGPMRSLTAPATLFAVAFFLASLVFMPGVLLGFSSDHRISRDEFFRTCGHNVWRFVRVWVMYAIIGGIIAGILFGIHAGLTKAAEQSANDDRIPYFTRLGTFLIIFLIMTVVRAWFDLAQTDVVLRDQAATRKSVAAGWRMTWRNLWRIWGSYVLIALVGLAILVGGLWLWHLIVPPASVFGAFLVSQVILLLLLAVRFWQRAAAVALYVRQATEPEVADQTAGLTAVTMS